MNDLVTLITVLACLVVAAILFMGLWNMFRGGDSNRSQMLMRARVIAQFVALVILMGALFFFGRGPHS
jgi:FtsZ-interacting cell division protein ZipA